MSVRRAVGLTLSVALVVSACATGTTDTTEVPGTTEPATTAAPTGDGEETAPEGDPIRVGVSLPLTGMFSIPGTRIRDGYQLCGELINEGGGLLGRPLELLFEDNRSDTETVVAQYERFINVERVDLIFGTFSTLLSFPASAVAEQAGLVFPEPADSALISHSRGFRYNFGFTLKPIDFIGQTPVDALRHYRDTGLISQGDFPQTAGLVYQDDFFPNAIARGLIGGQLEIPGTAEVVDFSPGYLAEVGLEVTIQEQFPREFEDWVGLANRIRNAEPDFLLALTTPPVELDLVRALQTVGYNPQAAFFSQGTYDEFRSELGEAADGIMVWSTWDPTVPWEGLLVGEPFSNQDFVAAFQERFESSPDEDNAQAFTICQAMTQAVHANETTDNEALRDWLASRTAEDPVRTIQGPYHFDDQGLTAERDVLLQQWQEGELRLVFPTGETYPAVDLVWPKPEW